MLKLKPLLLNNKTMKKISLVFILTILQVAVYACPVCERQQPKPLRGIIHGAGPQSNWDYVIVAVIATISVATLFFSVKWLIRPNEKNNDHIKYSILNSGSYE